MTNSYHWLDMSQLNIFTEERNDSAITTEKERAVDTYAVANFIHFQKIHQSNSQGH